MTGRDLIGPLALLAGLGAAALVLHGRFHAFDTAELRSGGTDTPWVVEDLRLAAYVAERGLREALVEGAGGVAAADVAPHEAAEATLLVQLARDRVPPQVRDALVALTGLDITVVGLHLLDTGTLDALTAAALRQGCGSDGQPPPLQAALCDPGDRARQALAVDEALGTLLARGEEHDAVWALVAAEGLGARAARIASTAARATTGDPARRDANVLMLRARTQAPDAALALLEAELGRPGPLGFIAVLELARLRARPLSLGDFATERAGSADAALATWALARP